MVAVVTFNEEDDILFIHNRRYTVGHLEWEIPAEKIEKGEQAEKRRREMRKKRQVVN